MFYIKKHYDQECDYEYIDATDILECGSESDPKLMDAYAFLCIVESWLNYFNNNRSTAFGNPDLERTIGMFRGYCMAKKWDVSNEDSKNGKVMVIRTEGGRCVYKIELPKIPDAEYKHRKEMARDMESLGL